MKTLSLTRKSLVALTMAAATLTFPLAASAQNFSNFRSNNNNTAGAQVAGGLIGGSVGAILGEGIAGRGNRTEGAVLGAIIGGVAGAAIGEGVADNNNTSSRSNRGFSNNRSFNNRGFSNNGFSNRGLPTTIVTGNRGFNTVNTISSRNRGFGTSLAASSYHQIDRIDYRIDELQYQQDEIYAELKYRGRNSYLKKRLYAIDCEIEELKDRRRFLLRKKRRRSY